MTIYQTADGKLWTYEALFNQTVYEAHEGWDEVTQGVFSFSFSDWLIEALYSGVVKTVEVIG